MVVPAETFNAAMFGNRNSGGSGSASSTGNRNSNNLFHPIITFILVAVLLFLIPYLFGPMLIFIVNIVNCMVNCSGYSCPDQHRHLADLASEALGGIVLNTDYKPIASRIKTFLGFPVGIVGPPPEVIIRSRNDLQPGNCWAFQGGKGSITIQLSQPAKISGFHLHHIQKSMHPSGILGSAPREFQILGYHGGQYEYFLERSIPDLLGSYIFENFPSEYFELQFYKGRQYEIIQLKIINNYGYDFTCVYRFEVHGDMSSIPIA